MVFDTPMPAVSVPGAFQARVDLYRERIERVLEKRLPAADVAPRQLHEAMHYSLLGGGKRIRPLLVYATGEVLGSDPERLDAAAAAVECIHAFSLVHDDLPAMDDDDLRRGRPTTHKAFGENIAILVGDALQSLAFEILVSETALATLPAVQAACVDILAKATGSIGMTGGQAIDLASEGQPLRVDELERMFSLKTGDLIRAAVLMACRCGQGSDEAYAKLDLFAQRIGLAFQIRDDVLDVEGATEVIGKTQGADEARGKATYPALFGLEESKRRADVLFVEAMDTLDYFGDASEPLRWLGNYIVHREY